jgi:hypothetical protein
MDMGAYGKQKMGFTKTGVTVDKQGVIACAGLFGNCNCSSMGKFVGVAYDKTVKGVTGHFRQGILCLALLAVIGNFIGSNCNRGRRKKRFAYYS